MSVPFIGEIIMFGGNYPIRGFAMCDGQLMDIFQNQELFSLIGTIYGGDGRTTFGLPDLRSRVPIHHGSGPGLSPRSIGSKAGSETQTLTEAQVGRHQHTFNATDATAVDAGPAGRLLAETSRNTPIYSPYGPYVDIAPGSLSRAGAGQSHDNVMPYQCVSFQIALVGIYPSRT